MAGKTSINKLISWLPTERTCSCERAVQNCLSERAWLRNQVPIWWFNSNEMSSKFDMISRKEHPAVFPTALAKRIIRNYSHENETVLDVFSGVGTTLYAARAVKRNAIGFELNEKFASFSSQRLKLEQDECCSDANSTHSRSTPGQHIQQICRDCRLLLEYLPVESVDLAFCSPPYWDLLKQTPSQRNLQNKKYLKKNYSNDRSDLSNNQTLDEFGQNIKNIFGSVHRVLKPGRRCVVNTADYRRKGEYISLSSMYIKIFQELGFELKNVIIWDRRREYNIGLFSYPNNFIVNNGMFEYILEFKK